MKILGYEITKIKKDKYIIIHPKATDGRVNFIELSKTDWSFHEALDMKYQVEVWIQQIETKFPGLFASDVVQLLNIFAGKVCEFKLKENS